MVTQIWKECGPDSKSKLSRSKKYQVVHGSDLKKSRKEGKKSHQKGLRNPSGSQSQTAFFWHHHQ